MVKKHAPSHPLPTSAPRTPQTTIDAQLAPYRSMRNFGQTQEPSGKNRKQSRKQPLPFVIQKHAASHLHYDFRLAWNGVFKSWAVAKGPSYVPKDKRLAVQVEDHPLEYGSFEGIIPKGQYGGGTVMVWDQGTWEPLGDVDQQLKEGNLKFILHGSKMHGQWALVLMKKKFGSNPNWLLVKDRDSYARSGAIAPITEQQPNSVITGRSLEEIASAAEQIWKSRQKNNVSHAPKDTARQKAKTSRAATKGSLQSLPTEKLPPFIAPELATLSSVPPSGDRWIHEIKLDGYRIQARKSRQSVQLLTRTGLDWTKRMPTLAAAVRSIHAEEILIDGEVVSYNEQGISSFSQLQASFETPHPQSLHYAAFDLLHLNGKNTRALSLRERKALLKATFSSTTSELLSVHEGLQAEGKDVLQHACKLHAEGIVSKQEDSPYTSGRTKHWLKLKCALQQELIICGFTLPSNRTHGIGALLLAYYNQQKQLLYAGRTGTGFTEDLHRSLRKVLDPLVISHAPLAKLPAASIKGVRWVVPSTVAEVRFASWTTKHLVRQASFQGLREDKPAEQVMRETNNAAQPQTTTKQGKKRSIAMAPLPHSIHLTHADKVFDEMSQLTKQQLAQYYWEVAPSLLPHITGRPISLVRCPNGNQKPCFFQKHATHLLPKGVETVMVRDKNSHAEAPYLTVSTREALASLAQIGVLELHPWSSTNQDLEHPDRIIFDLDPDPSIAWSQLAESAHHFRNTLESIGLRSFLKTTGGKGLHIVIPIAPHYSWDAIKSWTKTFATAMEQKQPDLYLTKMSKAARRGKIFIDYLRNERGATAVSPFSPRARQGVTVSVPLDWEELQASEYPFFSVATFPTWRNRLERDVWRGMQDLAQPLGRA